MIDIAGATRRKARPQTVGRRDTFPDFETQQALSGPTSWVLADQNPDERCHEPLSQEDLDNAKPSEDLSLSGTQTIVYGSSMLSTILGRKQPLLAERRRLRGKREDELRAARNRLYQNTPGVWRQRYVKQSYTKHYDPIIREVRDYENDKYEDRKVLGPGRWFPIYKRGTLVEYRWIQTLKVKRVRVKAWKTITIYRPPKQKTRWVPSGDPYYARDLQWFRDNWAVMRRTIYDSYASRFSAIKSEIDNINAKAKLAVLTSNPMAFKQTEMSCGVTARERRTVKTVLDYERPGLAVMIPPSFATESERTEEALEFNEETGELHWVTYHLHARFVGVDWGISSQDVPKDYAERIGWPVAPGEFRGHGLTLEEVKTMRAKVISSITRPIPNTASPVAKEIKYHLKSHPELIELGGEAEYKERVAATNVSGLHGSKDYTFNLLRSTLELKDIPKTVSSGVELLVFMKQLRDGKIPSDELQRAVTALEKSVIDSQKGKYWGNPSKELLGRLNVSNPRQWVEHVRQECYAIVRDLRATQLSTKAVLARSAAALSGLYLAWKFAIAPTIDDIMTCSANGHDWLLTERRFCLDMIKAQNASTILHFRQKWRDYPVRVDPSQHSITLPIPESYSPAGARTNVLTFTADRPYVQVWYSIDNEPWETKTLDYIKERFDGWYTRHSTSEQDCFRYEDRVPPAPWPLDVKVSLNSEDKQTFTSSFGVSRTIPKEEIPWLKDLTENLPVNKTCYATSLMEGVVYQNYWLNDCLSYLGVDGTKSLLDCLTTAADKSNALWVAWELTPLSFVVDWFANTNELARALSSSLSTLTRPMPITSQDCQTSMDGVWASRKCQVYTGVVPGTYEAVQSLWLESLHMGTLHWDYELLPRRWSVTFSIREKPVSKDGTFQLYASGARWAIRGAYSSDQDTPVLDLKPRLGLNCGKIATLAAMLSGMLSKVR